MKSEKLAVTVALAASVLALIVSIVSFMGSSGTPAAAPASGGRAGGGGPGGGMGGFGGGGGGYTPAPEYIAIVEERGTVLKAQFENVKAAFNMGTIVLDEYFNARLAHDEGRLALQRLKAGRRANTTFIDTLVRIAVFQKNMELAKARYDNAGSTIEDYNNARLKLLDEKLRLHEQTRRVGAETIKKAEDILKDYIAKDLTDEQITELVGLEPTRGGR